MSEDEWSVSRECCLFFTLVLELQLDLTKR